MNKKDYIAIASLLSSPDVRSLCLDDTDDRITLVRKFADLLQADSPAFKRDKFIAAAMRED